MTAVVIGMLLIFGVLLIAGLPIAFSIGIASLAAILFNGTIPLSFLIKRMFISLDSFQLLAVPFFIIAGDIMRVGGISRRLVDLANRLVGWFTGGLSYATIIASSLFGLISGSAVATTAAIGGVLYPEMIKANYKKEFAAAVGAVGGTLSLLIPPSIAFIIFGAETGTPIGKLFIGGGISGVFAAVLYVFAAYLELKTSGVKTTRFNKPTLKEIWKSFKEAFGGLLLPVLILGGIYCGVFTATEAAVMTVVLSIFIGVFIYKELTIAKLKQATINSAITSGSILFLVGVASLFSWIFSIESIDVMLKNIVLSVDVNRAMFLLIVNIIYLILGMLIDTIPIIILTSPIFFPIATSLGIDPTHFGVIVVFNLALGLYTPPFGMCLFGANSYSKQQLEGIVINCRYFYLFGLLALAVITFFPESTMWIFKFINI